MNKTILIKTSNYKPHWSLSKSV